MSKEVSSSIDEIARSCVPGQVRAVAPRRVKLSVGSDKLGFNRSVQIYTMFLTGKPVLHMVDIDTHFTAAYFL